MLNRIKDYIKENIQSLTFALVCLVLLVLLCFVSCASWKDNHFSIVDNSSSQDSEFVVEV